jgi:hypothetical protein
MTMRVVIGRRMQKVGIIKWFKEILFSGLLIMKSDAIFSFENVF